MQVELLYLAIDKNRIDGKLCSKLFFNVMAGSELMIYQILLLA